MTAREVLGKMLECEPDQVPADLFAQTEQLFWVFRRHPNSVNLSCIDEFAEAAYGTLALLVLQFKRDNPDWKPKPAPKIEPCPVCHGACSSGVVGSTGVLQGFRVECPNRCCAYNGPRMPTEKQAVRAHTAVCEEFYSA